MDILDQILAEDRAKAYSDSKGGYTKTTKTVVFPESTVSYSDEVEFRGYRLAVETEMVAGKEYTVVVDGKTYVVTSVAQESEGITGIVLDCPDGKWIIVYIHNLFCAFDWQESKTGTTTDVTISITTKDKTIHPIDQKFIPGAVLPVVELTTIVPVGEYVAKLSAEENAVLNDCASVTRPIFCKFTLGKTATDNAETTSCILSPLWDAENKIMAYNGVAVIIGKMIPVALSCSDGIWTVVLIAEE